MAQQRQLTSLGVGVLPLLLMGVTHLSLPPLQAMFEVEPRLMYAWYAVALLLGVVLLRRSRVVKDHEYNRVKAMKKVRHVYEAEERGVWQTDAHLDGAMDATTQAGLGRSVGDFSGEGPEMQVGDDEKVEVEMLSEASHVIKANARVTGSASLDEEAITGTVGAYRRAGPMDRLLDTVFGLFGIDSREEREQRRQARLRQAAVDAPVIAQRPVAPLRLNKTEDESEVNMTSMSDSGGVETVISSSGLEKDVPTLSAATSIPEPQESLESMAMMGQTPSASSAFVTAGPTCRGCGAPVAVQERFCPHCGLDL
jgi:hypothetical protein